MSATHFSGPLFVAGVPISGEGIPSTFGTVYFVDAENGNDSNTGLEMDEAKATVLAAYNLTVSNNHDVIVMTGAGAHAIADEIIVAKNRVHFVGLGGGSRYMGQRTRFEMGVTTGAAKAIIQITGVGVTFTNIKFRSIDTLSTSLYAVADGGEFTQFTNCSFEKATDLDQTGAAELLCNADTGYYLRCSFGNTIYEVSAARQNILLEREQIAGKVARDCIWEDCLFLMKVTSTDFAVVRTINANDIERLMLFKNCTFFNTKLSSASPAEAFDMTIVGTEGEVLLQDCSLHNIDNWAPGSKGVFASMPVSSTTGGRSVETL